MFSLKEEKNIIKKIIINIIFSKTLFSNDLRLFKINVFENVSFFLK